MTHIPHPESGPERVPEHARGNPSEQNVIAPNWLVVIEQICGVRKSKLDQALAKPCFALGNQGVSANEPIWF